MRHHRKTPTKRIPENLRKAPRAVLGKVIGEVRNRIGREREEAVLEALRFDADSSLPEWMISVEGATPEEDRRGIDIIVNTDIGKLFLQIKGTQKAVREFLSAHPKGNIVPFIVYQTDDLSVLREKLIACLKHERERILALRST